MDLEHTNMKKGLITMFQWGFMIPLLLILTLYSFKKMANTYEVEVRVKLGNQSTVIKQLVEANSSTSAQREAERLVKFRIQTSVKSCKQLK